VGFGEHAEAHVGKKPLRDIYIYILYIFVVNYI